MNKEIAKKWVEALRSGEYDQYEHGSIPLREGDTYSAPGVLCDLYDDDGWCRAGSAWSGVTLFEFSGECYSIPLSVLKEAEMEFGFESKISEMEEQGKTFLEIADEIERTMDE